MPFLLLTDFEGNNNVISSLESTDNQCIKYWLNGKTNVDFDFDKGNVEIELVKNPIAYEAYAKAFGLVHTNILKGNSFLTNLTTETPIELNVDLDEIFVFRLKYS
jgi:para-aminobenzoate synthetase component I